MPDLAAVLATVDVLDLAVRPAPDGQRAAGAVYELAGEGDAGEGDAGAVVARARVAPLGTVSRLRRAGGANGDFAFTVLFRATDDTPLLSAQKRRQSTASRLFDVEVRAPDGRVTGSVKRPGVRAGVTVFLGPDGERWALAAVRRRGWTVSAELGGAPLAAVALVDVAGRRARKSGAALRRYRVEFARDAEPALRALVFADLVASDFTVLPRGSS